MLVRYIRLTEFLSKSKTVEFKGFVLLKNNTILNVSYNVVSNVIPESGTLSNIFIGSEQSFENITNIVLNRDVIDNGSVEIIVELPAIIDVDNICCVCSDKEENHFTNIKIEIKDDINKKWTRFNKNNFTPIFVPNDYSKDYFLDPVFLTQKDSYLDESGEILTVYDKDASSEVAIYEYIFTSKRKISSGKYFVEFEYENLDRLTSYNYGGNLYILEADKDINVFTTTNTYGYYLNYSASALQFSRVAKTETTLQSFGPGIPNATVVDNITFAFLIDLDNNLIKPSINGMYGDTWRNIEKTSPTQEFLICARIRNMGRGTRLRIRTTPKYQYDDLTPEFKRDLFDHEFAGWKKSNSLYISPRKEPTDDERSFIGYNQTFLERGILKLKNLILKTNPPYLVRLYNVNRSPAKGYFKNKVQIDFPPLEPTSKKVILFSIKDSKAVAETRSNSLTGEFEFKYVEMGKPYLIMSYDKDEDYNAVIAGPLYPTLMPEFEENP